MLKIPSSLEGRLAAVDWDEIRDSLDRQGWVVLPGMLADSECDAIAGLYGPSEAFRGPMDYYAHAPQTAAILEKLARENPTTLACMHGSAWQGDGAALLRHLAEALS
mgnify:CR=1 FL=1